MSSVCKKKYNKVMVLCVKNLFFMWNNSFILSYTFPIHAANLINDFFCHIVN